MKKIYSIIFLLMFVASVANAVPKTAVVSGNWNSLTTWGGNPIPTSADDVTINSGITVTVTAAAVCNSLTTTGGILNVSSANLTITDGGFVTINSGGAIIFSSTNVINGGGGGATGVLVNINSGASLTTANASGFVALGGGSINVNPGNRGGPNYNTGANYTYNASGNQVTGSGITGAANLTFAGSGNKTLTNAGTTVSGTLSMQGTAALITTAPAYGAAAILEYKGFGAQTTTSIEFPSASGPANLKINNTSGVTLHDARSISGTVTFTNGILNTTSVNLLTFNSGSSVGGTPSDASYIDGPVRKLGVLPATFRFPTGDAGQYEFIEISGGTVSNDFTAQYIRTSATAIDADVTSPVLNVSNCDHWTLVQNTGTNTISVLLSWSDLNPCGTGAFVTNPATLTVAHYNGASWDEAGTGGSFSGTSASGTVTRTGVSVFSPFSLGNTAVDQNPLPVKLSNIRAFEKLQGIQIDWTAYQEENLSRYSIERSANGITYNSIGEVASLNSAVETNYGFFDASPLSGVNFYRIRSIDFDSRFGYSSIVKVNLDKSVKDISLYPNPATGGFISFQGADLAKGNYTAKVYNSTGMQVMGLNFTHTGGAINQTLKLPAGTKSGMYSLQLVNDDVKVMSKTFIVQ